MQRNMGYRFALSKKTLIHMWCTYKRQILTSFKEMIRKLKNTTNVIDKPGLIVIVKPGLINLGT